MATKKSTTRAKTKTARVSTSKRTKSAKASKGAAAKKRVNLQTLRKLLVVTVAAYLLVIVAVVLFMSPVHFDVTVPYTTVDPLTSQDNLTAAYRNLYTFDLRWLVVSLALVSAVLPVLYLTRLKDFYNKQIQKKQLWVRWAEMAVAGGLMLEGIALLSGWTGLVEVKFAWLVAAAIAFMGYLQENRVAAGGKPGRDIRVAIKVVKAVFVLLLAFSALMTFVYGLTASPWYVYALYAGLVAGFMAYGRHFGRLATASALPFEYRTQLLTLITRVGFSVLVIAGLLK